MATRLAVTVAVDASSAGTEADGRRREVNYTTELKALRTDVQNYPSSKHTHAAVWEPRWGILAIFPCFRAQVGDRRKQPDARLPDT